MSKSSAADPPLLLRAALRAYPRVDRLGYGEELLEAAVELSDESSPWREAGGLVQGGAQARLARLRAGLAAVDLRAGLARLAAPLAAIVAAIWGVAAAARVLGVTSQWAGEGATVGSAWLLLMVSLLVIGVARGQRGVSVFAAAMLLLQVFASAIWHSARGGTLSATPALQIKLGPLWFGPSLAWSLLPLVAVLVAACVALRPPSPRVPGIPRPLHEHPVARFSALVAPAIALGLLLHQVPGVLADPATRAPTGLPGAVFAAVAVTALWVAFSTRHGRDTWSVAGSLLCLALMPPIAYGVARLTTGTFAEFVQSRDLRVLISVTIGTLIIVAAVAIATHVLARVGLRAVDRRGGSALAVGHALPVAVDDRAAGR